ncbi:enoyl-CoA hydratase-related protein [Alkalihalobacillus deserti]|uniref:enoyl-CoA hydratase-related protein n=1 Tax=Alkalihalobacillus deserti TaxID=2879466 RepID=UPI001D14EBA7|nr:enoyl-CoA hydratase-related protein [Alkalihalobacillus deserti]
MSKDYLLVKKKDGIATIYINRPEKKNAFNYDMWTNLIDILEELELDIEVKVLVIRGIDDTAFVAGADISEFTTIRSTAVGEKLYNQAVSKVEKALMNFSKPTIAMIQKYCIGGGCIIALACDLRFSSESGIFAITPAKIGIIYSYQGTKNLIDLVGVARAKDLLFSARKLNSYEAYSYRLVERIFPDEEIAAKTYEYADSIARLAQKSIKGAKKIISEINDGKMQETEEIYELTVSSYASSDYQEGVKAFIEKRVPNFKEV